MLNSITIIIWQKKREELPAILRTLSVMVIILWYFLRSHNATCFGVSFLLEIIAGFIFLDRALFQQGVSMLLQQLHEHGMQPIGPTALAVASQRLS